LPAGSDGVTNLREEFVLTEVGMSMTWKEFNVAPMGRMLNAGIAISALAGVFIAFSTDHTLSIYVMMSAIMVTMLCGIASIGLAFNTARRQALILIFVLPIVAQLFFVWTRITHTTEDPTTGAIMILATVIFTFMALFPPKVTKDADQAPLPAVESSH
jgi:hypothetical protein